MFDHRGDLKNRTTSRFEKSQNFCPRNQGNFIRPPFPLLKKRMMSGRFPNTGFRPFNRPMFRPEFRMHRGTSCNFRYRSPPNPALCMTANVERPTFSNISPNRNSHYSCSPTNSERPSFSSVPPHNGNILYSCSPSDVEGPSFPNAPQNNRNMHYSSPPTDVERPSFPNVPPNNRNMQYSCSSDYVERPLFPTAPPNNGNIQYSSSSDNVERPPFPKAPLNNRNIKYSCSSDDVERPPFSKVPPNNRNIPYSCSSEDVERPSFPNVPQNNRNVHYSSSPTDVERPSFPNVPPNNRNMQYSCSSVDVERPSLLKVPPNNRNMQYSCSSDDVKRPTFPNFPPNNKIMHYSRSPIPDVALNYGENQIATEPADCRNTQTSDQNISDLWVEALSPIGRTYFYNARTRVTSWEKPINASVIELDEIQRLKVKPALEQTQIPHLQKQGPFVRPLLSSGPYVNSFYPVPRNFIMPSGFLMVPPPTTVYNTAKMFETPSREGVQGASDGTLNVMVPPPMLAFSAVACSPISNNVPFSAVKSTPISNNVQFTAFNPISNKVNFENGLKIVDSSMETNKNSLNMATAENIVDTKKLICGESKFSDWSVSDSKTYLSSSGNNNHRINHVSERNNNHRINQVSERMEDAIQTDNNNLCGSKLDENNQTGTKNELQSLGVSPSKDKKDKDPKENENQTDKSRPVSSTPVPGTNWCVVWTGDEKVFFYDYQLKASVWERPDELVNRIDVDKLIEKPILLMHEKPEITSSGSDVGAKKLKKDDEKENDHVSLKKDPECTNNKINIVKEERVKSEIMGYEQRLKIFREMLVENKVSASSTWEKELHKIVFDSRYLLLPSKIRKQVYESYILEKIEHEKSEQKKELHHQKENFRSLFKEADVTSKTRFGDFVQRYRKDPRFRVMENIKQKEIMFNQYVSEIIMKEKESEKIKTQQKSDFIKLLREQNILDKCITWSEVDKLISNDRRYKAIESKSLKENIFHEYVDTGHKNTSPSTEENHSANSNSQHDEGETKLDLSADLKKNEEDQKLCKHKSAVSDFKALLKDLINKSDISWYSAKAFLKVDRWDKSYNLPSQEREELFNQHIDLLKRNQFHRLLDETPVVTLKTSWLDIRDVILKDSRCTTFSPSERKCEKEFKAYLRQKLFTAKANFKELLKETKIITNKSKSLLKTTNHLRNIEDALSKDKRYLLLERIRNERKEILLAYIDKLDSCGSPPSPTATEP